MRATAIAQPNIALVKYWGKRDLARNLPAVGSISITLADLYTRMSVAFETGLENDVLVVNGSEDELMLPRISRCLDAVIGTGRRRAHIDSVANFPVAAGLASSASAFAALVVAAAGAAGLSRGTAELARLAGRASGSAARSLYGGFVELSNREDAIDVSQLRDGREWPLRVVVAITSAAPKSVGSGEAMEISRRTSPFYGRWLAQQDADLAGGREAIAERDFQRLAAVAEQNCLKMHSVMWACRPPVVYWNRATLDCMHVIRGLRSEGVGVFFTIDAGPQVKAVCLPADEHVVRDALEKVAGVSEVMTSGLGDGARLVGGACAG